MSLNQQPLDVLEEYWGYSAFRPMQEPIIQSVLDGKDTLALLPTGGGKSICFQVPALSKPGICIVVSPLIALMKDQVRQLHQREIAAAAIYSGMHYKDIDRILDNAVFGGLKFLYLSPERLGTELVKERLLKMQVNLIAVDEAHCISQWGYDFRPAYLKVAEIRDLIPDVPVLALTATATPEVVKDIQEKLLFKEENLFQQSFNRPNLAYVVLQEEGKEAKLFDILKRVKGSGIVYVRSRRRTKEVAHALFKKGIKADYYHAGLEADVRSKKQDLWIENKIRVMVCTNAFGMGIDKPDVRTVVHMELPDSLENYFQEAGRAGRDGNKSYAILLYNDGDRKRLERNYEASFPSFEEVRQVYRALGSYFQLAVGSGIGESFDFDLIAFTQNFRLNLVKTFNVLKLLAKEGWIIFTEAIFIPSKLKILVSKDELYDYQLKHPKLDAVLKIILRTYQGAFHHFINIREKQLAKFLKISSSNLSNALHKLKQDQIIDYRPQKDAPQIIFLRERIDANDLTIDQQQYNFRKKRGKERIAKAITYASQPRCRSQQLLFYFNEKDAKPCGICDVCTGRTSTDLSPEIYTSLKGKIKRILEKEELNLEQVVQSFAPRREFQVLKAIEYLMDEGFIEQKGELLTWKE